MSSMLDHEAQVSTARVDSDAVILEFLHQLRSEGVSESYVSHHPGPVRHFLTWLALNCIAVEAINGAVIEQYLQHDCECCASVPAPVRFRPWRKRRSSPKIVRFVRFLESTGRVPTPGDLHDNLRILDEYIERLRGDGYSGKTIRPYRSGCASLIVWLHLSRIRLRDLTPDLLGQFQDRQFICSIPGVFLGQRTHSPGPASVAGVPGFLRHLVEIGRIEPLEPAAEGASRPQCLERFGAWLERNRDLSAATVHRYTALIAAILPALGDDPDAYDAALIRRALFEHIEHRSRSHARLLTTSMRMYLRFLVSEGRVAAALIAAVPTVPQWQLSTLPRYISSADVERAIRSCGDGHAGVRDRAVLLLLARLALRAGDIVDLRLIDIDWDRAVIHVSGKSRRETALPLPQDVGDALYTYITTVRPRTDEPQLDKQKVFLGARAPHRPFCNPDIVTKIARRALDRADVVTFAGRGAHVFRHSQATALLRSGASLEVIASLLRHTSLNTTMIYAKTDTVMLQSVAQPWVGGGAQ